MVNGLSLASSFQDGDHQELGRSGVTLPKTMIMRMDLGIQGSINHGSLITKIQDQGSRITLLR